MKAYLSRTVRFSAWHRYHRPDWSEARNHEAFGAAGREPAHGHDYACTVTVSGEVDPQTGMVMDLGLLDRILREEVSDRFDRRVLPADPVPTGEQLCLDVWQRVGARLPLGCALSSVRMAEDATLWAEFRGEA